jgi:excisionase family DNA binding protein
MPSAKPEHATDYHASDPAEESYLTASEAAQLLNISPGTLHAWVSTGRVDIPFISYAPQTVRFPRRQVLAWLKRKQEESLRKQQERCEAQARRDDKGDA